ncbi:MAG: hypothetical protein GY759_07355 [Chloroflexi bacterium]|nr:hypothetical protein [Chloroflexota bacterium]
MRDLRMFMQVVAALIVLLATACAGNLPAGDAVVTTSRPDDTVTVEGISEVVVDIDSPSGIGEATIELASIQTMQNLTILLHLNGLESFRFLYGDTEIGASVSSHGDQTVREYQVIGSEEQAIAPENPLWMDIRYVQEEGESGGGGYYEVSAPESFYQSSESSFEISWIDFYR